ncbi:MAG: hypothetical protein USCAAHI_01424 [Beijerinckiaceae bacterium]|nr:MAG: hypothetical protein USCAAHI_01424 [Beijerinckiaceae bacterium]
MEAIEKNARSVAEVTQNSDAMDVESGIFKSDNPTKIARSLKRSAEHNDRLKSSPFRSAMSMVTFYLKRGGKNLSAVRKRKLEAVKVKLREAFKQPSRAVPLVVGSPNRAFNPRFGVRPSKLLGPIQISIGVIFSTR